MGLKRLYPVYLWGGPLFFWKLGDENFSMTNIFFSVSLSVKTFISGVIFLIMPAIPPPPPPLNVYDLPMVYNALIF